jgi:hypothetical protein
VTKKEGSDKCILSGGCGARLVNNHNDIAKHPASAEYSSIFGRERGGFFPIGMVLYNTVYFL